MTTKTKTMTMINVEITLFEDGVAVAQDLWSHYLRDGWSPSDFDLAFLLDDLLTEVLCEMLDDASRVDQVEFSFSSDGVFDEEEHERKEARYYDWRLRDPEDDSNWF
jgi:hypothetical protein